jgi:hypothetical protein
VDEETQVESWKWRRVDVEGDEISASDEDFLSENLATADAAKKNPGIMVHTPDIVARVLPEKDAQEIREASEGDAGTDD